MFTLKTQSRKLFGRKAGTLRKSGVIPAVVYGHNFKTQSIQVPYQEFEKIYKQARESSLIDLEIEGEKSEGAWPGSVKVLIHDIQYHPLTNQFQHIDFYKIKAGEKITVEVELKLTGLSPAVKELGGVLVSSLDEVEIECLPEDLIHQIEVDISGLKNFDDIIRVGDLKVPRNIKILQNPKDVVVNIERPREEEVAEGAPEEKVEEVERIGETVKEEKEGKEEKEKKEGGKEK